ncbi:MAG: Ig-like domain-containing protein [Acutalibacteraceae bacterium]|nr:Ig-like domain-containing protein [Acutalibacteraceae bacterium]
MNFSKRIISTILTAAVLVCSIPAISMQAVAADTETKTVANVKKEISTGSISLSKSSITMGVGETYKLTATLYDTDNVNQKISWGSSNSTIVSVNNGMVTAKKNGTVTVIARLTNGEIAKCKVTIKNAPTYVSLNKTNITLGIGETFDLNSSLPVECGAYSIKYSTNNSNVASVKSAGGLVTAESIGKAVITATTYNGKTVSCNVTVNKAPNSISLNKTSLTLGIGESYDLNSSLPKGCSAYNVKYSSNNPNIASVKSAGGLVTAKSAGTAYITVKAYNGISVTCKVTVKNAPSKVNLNKTTLSLAAGGEFDLNSSLPSNTASYSVKYTSSNPNVASVKSAGGIVSAKSTGTTTITATTFNGKKATCKVTVTNGYTDDDLYCLAAVIWQEAGSSYCSDRLQLLVANVVMNRVDSPYFSDTIREVITRKGAYGTMYWDGVSIPVANDAITQTAIDRCYANAKKILDGYRILPENVIYQAGFVQGSGVYTYEEGLYFCYQ